MPERAGKEAVYNFGGEPRYYLKRIDGSKDIDPGTKQSIKNFLANVLATGEGAGRQAKYAAHLWVICERLGKPIEEVSRRDIEKVMRLEGGVRD
jgi:hypothetical protein